MCKLNPFFLKTSDNTIKRIKVINAMKCKGRLYVNSIQFFLLMTRMATAQQSIYILEYLDYRSKIKQKFYVFFKQKKNTK